MNSLISNQCLFCNKNATTRDHIPTKNLLEKPYPLNLFTVPACQSCNNSFSLDEEYFLNVLVEITTNPILIQKKLEGGSVFKARARSEKLRYQIQKSLVLGNKNRIYFDADFVRITKVIEKNALGLFYKRYNCRASLNSFKCIGFYPFNIMDERPPSTFISVFTEKFRPRKWNVIQKGIFSYIIVRNQMDNNKMRMILNIHETVWAVISVPYPNNRVKSERKLLGQLELWS